MATASELKVKVAKIATIVEYLEDEQISQIEKDILLQAVRELYCDILVTDTTKNVVENTNQEEESVNEQQEAVEEPVDENVAETVAAAVVPPVISVAFDDGEFDFSELLKDKTTEENAEVQETNAPVENIATEDVPAEEAEPEAEIEEPVAEFEPEEFDEPEPEDIEDVDSAEEYEEEDDEDEDSDEVEPETLEEVENEVQDAISESNFEETVTDNTEINYSFNEEHLQEEQPTVEEDEPQTEETIVNEPVAEETPAMEEEPVVEEAPIVEAEDSVVDEPQVAEMPTIEEPVVETPQNDEEKTFDQEKPEPTHITLGEQLGQSRQSSLNDKFASNKPAEGSFGLKPISDIKSAIPLGERFRFTRMLFSGNGPAFDSTVAALNGMSSMEAADNYIRTNFSWDMDSPVVADFMNIVRRRYL